MKKITILFLLNTFLFKLFSQAVADVNIEGNFSCGNTVTLCASISCNQTSINCPVIIKPSCPNISFIDLGFGCIQIVLDDKIPNECCKDGYIEFLVYHDNCPFIKPYDPCAQGFIKRIPFNCCSTVCEDDCYWKVTGNNILNGNNIFGTKTNDDINIYTNNIARGVITKDGQYLFGNINPLLNPSPLVRTNGGLQFENLTTDNSLTKLMVTDATGNVKLKDLSSIAVSSANIYNTDGVLTSNRQMNLANYNLQFLGGKFGIGISPTEMFHTNGNLKFEGLSSSTDNNILVLDNNNIVRVRSVSTLPTGITMPACSNNYIVRKNATSLDCSIIYDDGARIGIGVSPILPATIPIITHKLHVEGKVRITDIPSKTTGDEILFANSDGEIRKLSLNNNDFSYLSGKGEFEDITVKNGCSRDGKNIVFGNDINSNDADLISDRYIPMKNIVGGMYDINFLGENYDTKHSTITIGYDNSTQANLNNIGKLSVNADGTETDLTHMDISGNKTGISTFRNNIGIFSNSNLLYSSPSNQSSYGIYSIADGNAATLCQGGTGCVGTNSIARFGSYNIGVRGEAISGGCIMTGPTQPILTFVSCIGGDFTANTVPANPPIISPPGMHYGVKALARNGGVVNYGIYADGGVFDAIGNSLITNDYAGFFDGDVYSSGIYAPSDKNLKDDIADIANSSKLINQLTPFSYKYKSNTGLSLPQVRQFGFIAQDVEKILPTLVRSALIKDSFKTETIKVVNYQGFIPILWKYAQDQISTISQLEEKNKILSENYSKLEYKLNKIEDLLNEICNNGCGDYLLKNYSKSKSNEDLLYYFDNKIFVDRDFKNAQLQVVDINGRQIMDTKVSSDNVDFIPSTNGIYIATVIKDGQVAKTIKFSTAK